MMIEQIKRKEEVHIKFKTVIITKAFSSFAVSATFST
jgi:hypothetical protein